jgi:superfamily II DNA or RNA helicase
LQSASPVARLLSDNACRLYKPFSAVPARILAKVDYLGHGVGEYNRILNDSTLRPDKCGYTERGGDGMLEREDNGGLVVLQDKDHKHLDRADLTSFLDFTADCVTHNVNLGMERDDVHGLLIFPEDSRVGEGSRIMMERRKRRGIYSLALHGFEPRNIQDADCPAFALADEQDAVPPNADHRIVPRVASMSVETGPDSEVDIIAAVSRPLGGEDRPFQQIAAQRIASKAGFHLVHGPPGVGKTCILAQATGSLVMPEGRQTRRSVPQGELYVKTVALMTAPFVTHARQLYWRMQGVLGANFGENWQKFAAFLACETVNKQHTRHRGKDVCTYVSKDVPTKAEVLHAFKKGTCVFVSTEDSAELLFNVATAARAAGCRLLVIKDEAHFASSAASWSTKLMGLVDPAKGDRAILATATPNFEVMRFPFVMWPKRPAEGEGGGGSSSASIEVDPSIAIVTGDDDGGSEEGETEGVESVRSGEPDGYEGYEHSFYMSINEAIERGYCCDYKIILPQVVDISNGEDVPIKVRNVVKAHNMGNAAMMTIQAMHARGTRRCIAYADDSVESAKAAVESIRSVCETAFESVYGIQCVAHVITHDVSPAEREARLHDFEHGAIETEPDENGVCFPIFRFLVAVRILDQCIDLPSTDTISVMYPPTSTASVLSIHRTIQRFGRGLRPKPNGSIFCIYIDRDSPWFHLLLDVLSKYDHGVERRVCVRSSNPASAYESAVVASEEVDTQAVNAAYRVHVVEVAKRTEGVRSTQVDAFVAQFKDAKPKPKDGAKLVYHIDDVTYENGAYGWLQNVRNVFWPSLPDDCKSKLRSLVWWEDKKDRIEYSAELNMQEAIAFMETHNRRPNKIAKDEREKYLGQWLYGVTTTEKKRTPFVKTMGEAAYTTLLASIDTLFPANLYPLRRVVEFVLENKRVPKQGDKGGKCLTNIRQGILNPVHRTLAISMVEEKLAGTEFDSARKYLVDSVELSFTNHAEHKRKERESNKKRGAAKSTNPTGGTSTAPAAGTSGTKRSAPSVSNSSGKPPTKRGKTVLVE